MANNVQLKVSTFKDFNTSIRDTRTQDYLTQVLGNRKAEFVSNLIAVVSGNENLQQCDPMSLIFTAMKATALNLPIEPSLGKAAIIPYNDTKAGVVKAQFQIMRDGWVELLLRSGQVKNIINEAVHEGELVKKNKFTGEYFFDEEKRTSDKVIGFMARIQLKDGFDKTVFWTTEEINEHGKRYSQTFKKGYGLWIDNYEAMAKKTVLKNLLKKYAPISVDYINKALAYDQATFDADHLDKAQYLDNPENAEFTEIKEETPDEKKEKMRKEKKAKPEMP